MYTHLKKANNSSSFFSRIFSEFMSKTTVLNVFNPLSSRSTFIITLSLELKIKFTSFVKNLCFFSVFKFIISINFFLISFNHFLSQTATIISSVSRNISVFLNFFHFKGNSMVHLSFKASLK
ncbi:MAG: hypothetical protein LBQ24_04990 [Candidatus Peribacteria bacterium]|nr:hypothetical protein [Candidatus Peribacteria bacterium]